MPRKATRPVGRRTPARIAAPLTVWTIGHSRHPLEHFVGLLRRHGIEVLADVRSIPRSRFVPHVNRDRLAAALAETGIAYTWLGEGLGGRPTDARLLDVEGHPRYDRIAASRRFRQQVDELLELARDRRVAVMCAEEDPRRCHRRLLLTPALVARGVAVVHIRGDGTATAESDLARVEASRARRGQGTLFAE